MSAAGRRHAPAGPARTSIPVRHQEPVDVTALVSGCAERARVADPARTWRARHRRRPGDGRGRGTAAPGGRQPAQRMCSSHTPGRHRGARSPPSSAAGHRHHRGQRRRPRRSSRPAAVHLRALLPRWSLARLGFPSQPAPADLPARLRPRPGHRRRDRISARRHRASRAGQPARPPDHADPPSRPAVRSALGTRASRLRQLSPVPESRADGPANVPIGYFAAMLMSLSGQMSSRGSRVRR